MRLNSLSKRCMALLLSLSLVAGQGCLASLNLTALAATGSNLDSTAEKNLADALDTSLQEGDAGSFLGLAKEDMPCEPEDLLDEYYADYASEALGITFDGYVSSQTSSSTPDIILSRRDVSYKDSFTIKYTTVTNTQKEYTFTSSMNPTVDILMTPYGNDSWFGFKVLSIAVEVEDDKGNRLVFYADEILSSDFYITVDMELSNSDRLKGLEYTATPDDNDSWKPYTDAVLTSGRYSIKVRNPYGAYLAMKDAAAKEDATGKALLIVLNGDLGSIPLEDMQALKSTLTGTKQFKEDDIEILEVPSEDGSGKYKQKVWDWIDKTAQSGSELSFIGYSGHGGYHDDGTAELSLGGDNTISGVEFKQHIKKLSGKVMVLLDCCFSGGMIMPTMESDELNLSDTSTDSSSEGEALLESFIEDFNSEEAISQTAAANQAEPTYYIYTAASPYETSLQSSLGGQLITRFGYGLGYDRRSSSYNIFAADINSDNEVSAKELASYVSSSCLKSKPMVYYPDSKADEALFTYDAAAGVSAILSIKATTDGNVQMDSSTGKVSVPVKVTNYSSKAVTFDAGAVPISNIGENCPGAIDLNSYTEEEDKGRAFYTKDINKQTIAAGGSWEGFLTFTDETKQYFGAGGRYLIKIWGTNDEAAEAFAVTDFYIADAEKAEAVDDTGKKAFAINQPAQVYGAADGAEVSSIAPINVIFDTEPTKKKGYAALTLTARAYDLGTSYEGYVITTDGDVDKNDVVIADDDSKWFSIYENIRPTYTKNDMYADETTGSSYSYAWDVSGLTNDHYYAVQILCKYDDGTSQKKATFIKKTDKQSSDEAEIIIGESFIDTNYFGQYWGGIKVGDKWKEYNSGATVKEITDTFTEYLNDAASYKYDLKSKDISYSIYDANASDGCSSGWWKYNGKEFVEMTEDEHFESGTSYMNRIILTIDSGYNAKFAYGAVFTVPGHSLVEKATSKISDDQKTATIYVMHFNLDISEDYLSVCRAGTKTTLTDKDELKIGDQIDIYVKDGYGISTSEDSGCLKKINTNNTPYTRYEVVQNKKKEIQLTVYKMGSGASTDDCNCGTVFYAHDITDTSEGIKSITAPTKTFYDYYKTNKLDLSGAEVTYYSLNNKTDRYELKTADLKTFMQATGAKLYIKKDNKYLAWKDSYLKNLGALYLYLLYNGEYINAFDVETGYVQGAKFSLNGDFTYNIDGSVNYVSDSAIKSDAVLSLNTESVINEGCQGYINITHYAMLKEDNANASDYSGIYFANGASIRYKIPYPKGLNVTQDSIFNVKDEDKNTPVKLEVSKDGLWITAYRNGSFTIDIDTGGKGGPCGDDSSSSSGSSQTTASNISYGTWQAQTVKTGQTDADTANLYRFMLYTGEYATGWKLIRYKGDDSWFLFGEDGYMRTGWAPYNGKWYYLNKDGSMASGWVLDNGSWYFMNTDGSMHEGWQLVNGSWYYFGLDGKMVTGSQLIDGKMQYFDSNGAWVKTA